MLILLMLQILLEAARTVVVDELLVAVNVLVVLVVAWEEKLTDEDIVQM